MQRTTLIITHFCHLWKAKCRLKLSALFMKAWLMTGECLSFQAVARMFVADSHRGTRRSLAEEQSLEQNLRCVSSVSCTGWGQADRVLF